MSLLQRWSLPSRGFIRTKSREEEPAAQSGFSTIHIAPRRRRANISSAFSTLFEKTENRRNIVDFNDRHDGVDDSPLLGSRNENVPPSAHSKHSNFQKVGDVGSPKRDAVTSLEKDIKLGFKNIDISGMEPPRHLWPGTFGRDRHNFNEMPTTSSTSLFSSSKTSEKEKKDDDGPFVPAKRTHDLERIRSTSSSYPSEGIRSPHDETRSPELTAQANEHLGKYWRYGKYPSRSSWRLSSMPMSEAFTSVAMGIQRNGVSRASSDTISGATVTAQKTNSQISPFLDPPKDRACSNVMRPNLASGINHRGRQHHEPSSYSEISVPILENEDGLTSQLDVTFMAYKKPKTQSMYDGNDDSQQRDNNITEAEQRQFHRTETNETALTAIRHSSISETDDAWSTIHESGGAKPLAHRTSWMQLFTLGNSNGSSQTLAQRLQNLKLPNWVRKVCFRTKARFEFVGRPVNKLVSAHMWRQKKTKRRVRKRFGGKNGVWGVGKTAGRMRQTKTLADRILGPLVKRKSVQFGFGACERGRRPMEHMRVRSCPADLGL